MATLKSAASICCFLLIFAFAGVALGQTGNQGSIEGTVFDPSGAVVPGATLTASNAATGASFTAQSNADGIYRFAVLPVGTYDLKLEKSGFTTSVTKDIVVTVGAKIDLDLKLAVSGTTSEVNVSAETPLVETTRTQLSSTVDATSVRDLPVNGRNFIDFVLLTPGVTRDVRTGDISFAGQRGTLNSLTVDGADDNNTFFGQTTGRTGSGRAPYQFSQDAVQEFQVNNNGYSAELGRAGGAVINVVTKSGTNAFHGDGFWFYRDRALTANDPINKSNAVLTGKPIPAKPPYHFNQFGGDLGGPIVKNKLFFFFDYDGQRNTQPNTVSLVLPAIAAPDTFQTAAMNYLTARSQNWARGLNQNTYLLKGDWNISPMHQLSARWNRQNFTGAGFENGGPTNSFEHTGASLVNTDTAAVSLTSTFTPTLVNVVRFNYQKDDEPGEANSNLPEAQVRQGGITLLTVGRNFFSPRFTNINRQQYADTVTISHGRSTIKFGGDVLHDGIANFFPGNFSGSYTFNCLENFGRSLAGQPLIVSAALGCPASTGNPAIPADTFVQAFAGAGTTGPTTHPNITQLGFFVQDDFRMNTRLTLNLGLRYDVQLTAKPPVANPVAAAAGIHTDQLNTDTNNIGPRFGFAWTPTGSDRTVVRGGYGIFYGNTPSIMVGTAHSNNGINVGTKTFTGTDIPAYPNTKCGAPVDSPSCAAPTAGTPQPTTIFVMQPGFQQPMVQQANLSVEHQLSNDVSLSIGWQMVKGNDLQRTRDINLAPPVPTPITFAATGQTITYLKYSSVRPIAAFSRIEQFESSANSLYHGMFIQATKRMSHNFQGSLAYTWSHVIDDVPDATSVVPLGSDDAKMLSDPLHPRVDRASGLNDQRHRLVMSGVWQLNYADGLSSAGKAVLGGWELSFIFSAQSGQPYAGLVGVDLNNDSNRFTDRLPTEGRDRFTLPATWSLDPRFLKNVNVTERVRMQVFVEAFNLFNHFNVPAVKNTEWNVAGGQLVANSTGANAFGIPTAPGGGSNYPFGAPVNLDGARIFQLGAKIIF